MAEFPYPLRGGLVILVGMDALTTAVAAALRAERAASQLTQKEVAAKSRLGYQTVMRLEKGERSPNVEQLAALCSVYGLTISELIERAEGRL